MNVLGLILVMPLVGDAAVTGDTIFADGIEDCSMMDAGDHDRLSACEELARKTDPNDADTDDDGISDGDEVLGTVAGLALPQMGVHPRKKNILLEYDWFDDANETDASSDGNCKGPHSHQPTQAMLDIVTAMFAAAPVANPDGSTGIAVIHDVGQGGVLSGGSLLSDADGILIGDTESPDYYGHYTNDFAANRKGYFHYVVLPHRYVWNGKDSSTGFAPFNADKMIVALYCHVTVPNVGKTIAHELGHNLGLMHGGDDSCNRKPNYNSIMNYRFSFPGVDTNCDAWGDGVADFSRGSRPPLDESNIDETSGVCALGTPEHQPIDWDLSGGPFTKGLTWDLNNYTQQFTDCPGQFTVLFDHDDWSTINVPSGLLEGVPFESGVACEPPFADAASAKGAQR